MNEAATRAIDVGDEKKGNGDQRRQDEEQDASCVARAVSDQDVTADGNGYH